MSANPTELFSGYEVLAKPLNGNSTLRVERRKRARTRVHWPVLFFRQHTTDAVESVTQNLSSSGFYCLLTVALLPGEYLACVLTIPSHDPIDGHQTRTLECKVRVVRAEPVPEGLFGVACRIEDYRFLGASGR